MIQTTIALDLSRRLGEVNPYIYGNFIEFIQDCIDGGLWAELLANRGFENGDANQDGVSDPWVPTGYNDLALYTLDDRTCFNSRYSQKLEVLNHYGGYRGIAQPDLRLVAGETYRGYVWLKAEDLQGEVKLNIRSGARPFYSQSLDLLDLGWHQYHFEFQCDSGTEDGAFEIALYGTGKLWIDQVSLMPRSAVNGVWAEVLKATQALQPGIMRFPGGCFADCYHWEDGIGPRDVRPTRENRHWKGNEENNFGTDEYLRFCRNTACEPLICVNFGSGSPEEAVAWVEYCNGSVATPYGKLRAANGHPEPYAVKYWQIGNEVFGDWEIGHCHAAVYAERYLRFYRAMKAKDPAIKILACGGDGNNPSQHWNRTLLAESGGNLDYLALHFYAPKSGAIALDNRELYYGTVGAVAKYESIIRETADLVNHRGAVGSDIKIAVTEWNTSYNNSAYREQTLEAAIFNAGMLNMFLRNCNVIEIGNFSDLVNGWPGGCIRNEKGKVYFSPSYYVLQLYSGSGLKSVLTAAASTECYDVAAVGHIEAVVDVPYVDVAAGLNENHELVVFAVNRHLERCAAIRLNLQGAVPGKRIRVSEISGNPSDVNSATAEKIKIAESFLENHDSDQELIVPPCSVTRWIITVNSEQ